jgi:hypothetical protein
MGGKLPEGGEQRMDHPGLRLGERHLAGMELELRGLGGEPFGLGPATFGQCFEESGLELGRHLVIGGAASLAQPA